jgi:hypothetical protein
VIKRYPRPLLANGETVSTPAEALEVIRYLTGEWLHNPAAFGQWAGGAYMEQVHKVATAGLAGNDGAVGQLMVAGQSAAA